MSQLIPEIVKRLGFGDLPCNVWVEELQLNLITTVAHLFRLLDPKECLEKLGLPMILQAELLRIMQDAELEREAKMLMIKNLDLHSTVLEGTLLAETVPKLHLSSQDISLIRDTWQQVQNSSTSVDVGGLNVFHDKVYTYLFANDPNVKKLFPSSIKRLGPAMVGMVTLMVRNIENPRVLNRICQTLGSRHRIYGVESKHYTILGGAVLRSLTEILGTTVMNKEAIEAWKAMYTAAATIMCEAGEKSTTGYSGWLYYKKTSSTRWRHAWCVLTNYRLLFYKSKESIKERHELNLKEIGEVTLIQEHINKPKELVLQVYGEGENFHLCLESEQLKCAWLHEIDWRVVASQKAAYLPEESKIGQRPKCSLYSRWKKENSIK